MLSARLREMLGGVLLIALGLFVAWYAHGNFAIGTFRRMGPGMFPMGAGLVLAFLGLLIAGPAALARGGDGGGDGVGRAPGDPRFQPVAVLCVLAGIIGFALILPRFGLFPAIAALVAISSLAGTDRRPFRLLVLIVALWGVAWAVFRLGLNLPLTLFRWP